MSYLNVITLQEAKNYLRVDSDLTDDDDMVTLMIEAALSSIEQETRHILYDREETYLFQDYCVRVYDFPINSVTSPTDVESSLKPLYTLYEVQDSDDEILTLNVGYDDASNVPQVLKKYGLYLVELYYYDAKGGDKEPKLPMYIRKQVDQLKRFYA